MFQLLQWHPQGGRGNVMVAREPAGDRRAVFIPECPTSHTTKKSPNQTLGTPIFGAQKGPFKVPPTFLELAVRILQILNCADIPGMPISSIICYFTMLIQNWSIDFWMLLMVNKFGLADSFLSSIATLFRVRLSASS